MSTLGEPFNVGPPRHQTNTANWSVLGGIRMETAETFDQAPSPWWPCPECGGIELRATVLFERGQWDEDDKGVYVEFDPPEGIVAVVRTGDVQCETCGYQFDIHRHYQWPDHEETA